MTEFVNPAFYKKFDARSAAETYATEIRKILENLGFDPSLVKVDDEYDYRCSHRYYDYSEVYIDTKDDVIINALKLIL